MRESARLLQDAYQSAQQHELVRHVYKLHIAAIAALEMVEKRLWDLGEIRWSATYGSRACDLEVQARRHINAIVERLNSNGGTTKL
jgi:hypothetical protein